MLQGIKERAERLASSGDDNAVSRPRPAQTRLAPLA
ncbi:MAG: hypothetical protein QOJ63_135 [Solirubrobacteraceae bacterium]|nr:hypothetical protein [Solirubrobacteraceae bacterium]